jgi:hypothetical protein
MKCPVCDWEIKNGVAVQHNGKKTVVCCKECADKLKKAPKGRR